MIITFSKTRPFLRIDEGHIDDYRSREKALRHTIARDRLGYSLYRERFRRAVIGCRQNEQALPRFPVIKGNVENLELIIPETKPPLGSLERRLRDRTAIKVNDAFLRRQMAGHGTFIDIGANVGLTIIPHILMNDFSAYLAFEPEERNLACLRYNLARNGFDGAVDVREAAIGEKTGQTKLTVAEHSGCHFLTSQTTVKERTRQTVPVMTLDHVISEHDQPIALIKSDTQGYEGHILAGAREFLSRRTACWYLEFWPGGLERAGSSVHNVCALIEANFTSFVDPRRPKPRIYPVAKLREKLPLSGKFTDLLLIP